MKRYIISFFIFLSLNALAADPFQDQINSMVPEMASRIGRSLPWPVTVLDPDQSTWESLLNSSQLEALRLNEMTGRYLGLAYIASRSLVDGKWVVNTDTPETCLVYFSNSIRSSGDSQKIRSTIAHELYHCFQYALLGNDRVRAMPRWLIEGSAEYIGEAFSGGSSKGQGWWREYLTIKRSLFDRTYDSLGFWSHVARAGRNLFQDLDMILQGMESIPAFNRIFMGDAGTMMLATWPMAIERKSEWGEDWTPSGPGLMMPITIPYPIEDVYLSSGVSSVMIPLYSVTPLRMPLDLPSDKFYKIIVRGGHGGMHGQVKYGSVINEFDTRIYGEDTFIVCEGEKCECPDGERPAEDFLHFVPQEGPPSSDIHLFLTAAASGMGNLTIEEFEPTCCNNGRISEEFVGNWELDYGSFLEYLYIDGSATCNNRKSFSGSHTLTIRENGAFTKSFNGFTTQLDCYSSRGTLLETNIDQTSGVVTGCMREAGDIFGMPDRIRMEYTRVEQFISFTAIVNGSIVPSYPSDSEPPYTAFWGLAAPARPDTVGIGAVGRPTGSTWVIRSGTWDGDGAYQYIKSGGP